MPQSQFTLQMPINLFTSIHLNPVSLKGAIGTFKEFQLISKPNPLAIDIAMYILVFLR